jgi:nicotinamide-nucleotide amidase
VAVTGLLTPGGSETPEKPVGTIFIHIILPHNRYCAHREVFKGNAESIIKQTIDKTGILLTDFLHIQE